MMRGCACGLLLGFAASAAEMTVGRWEAACLFVRDPAAVSVRARSLSATNSVLPVYVRGRPSGDGDAMVLSAKRLFQLAFTNQAAMVVVPKSSVGPLGLARADAARVRFFARCLSGAGLDYKVVWLAGTGAAVVRSGRCAATLLPETGAALRAGAGYNPTDAGFAGTFEYVDVRLSRPKDPGEVVLVLEGPGVNVVELMVAPPTPCLWP